MVSINGGSNKINSYSSKGFSGLASGIDTESLVKQLLANTQSKIDKQTAIKQQTIWKQDIYRDLITSFQGFQTKFFDFLTPKTNLLANSFYQTKAVKSSSSAVKVNPLGDILNNKLKIDEITELASARKEVSNVSKTSGEIKLNIDLSALTNLEGDTSLTLKLDGVTRSIKLSAEATATASANTTEALIENLNNAVKQTFGDGVVFNVDGTVSINADRQLVVSGNEKVQTIMGFEDEVSNKINLNTTMGDVNLANPLAGNAFKFKINDVEFSFDKSNTISDVIRKVNSSDAKVKMSYSALTDKFSIESTVTGAGINIKMEQTEGNLLTSLFGVASGESISSSKLNAYSIQATNDLNLSELKSGGFIELEVNGVKHNISIPKKDEDDYTSEELLDILNKDLKNRFGKGNIQLELNGTKLELQAKHGFEVSVLTEGEFNLGAKLGFTDKANNLLSADPTVADLGFASGFELNGVSINGADKISDLLSKIEGATYVNGKLSISRTATEVITGDTLGKQFLNSIFGVEEAELNSADIARVLVQEGTNAKLKVNGVNIERNTNEFNLDGFQVTILEKSNAPIELSAENSTDQIVDGITQFVNDYNNLVEKITKLVSQKQVYKEYAPLTSEQKSEMSDKEVELWEEKAKEGLVNADPLLNRILGQMRTALYQKPENSDIALYDIGITTSKNYRDNGKLIINEDALRAAINKDPSSIAKLFTDSEGGIASTMNKIIDGAAKSSVASPGSLVAKAGVKNTATETQNVMNQQMRSIEEAITRLKNKYEMEKTRYWKQFSAMEKMINRTNSQASWLSGMSQ